jgi:hypothetical protein
MGGAAMIDNRKNMSCEEFQAQMADLIGSGADASAHPHVQNCDLCRAFLADLEAIAAAARELFPVEDPSDRVWEQIQSAIQEEEGKTSAK